MGKKRNWFSFVKRLFIPETKSKVEKKTKSWGWIFGGLKFKQYPEIAAPQKTLTEATEEQRKHVLAVAIATAAAAEAAVAAANAAAEVVKLTGFSPDKKRIKNLAAVRIQSAYRRHLARKALNALKGLVKLQAVIRGELVRRKVIPTLKFLPSLVSTPRICQIRVPMVDVINGSKWKQCPESMIESQEFHQQHHERHKSWDFSLVSKEEMEALWFKKQEAVTKRERMKKYSYSHRESRNDQLLQESIKTENGRQSCRFNQLREVEVLERGERERLKSFAYSNNLAVDINRMRQLRLNSPAKQDSAEVLNSPFSLPRRSFCQIKQKSIEDDNSLPNSPAFPTYMASTESAKAKTRSISTPKQRLILSESYSGQCSPCKSRLSPWSSFNGDMISSSRKSGTFQPMYMNPRGHYWD